METKRTGYLIGAIIASIVIVGLQSWALTVIFSWFNLQVTIWQALGMIVLIKSITAMGSDK